MPDDRAHEAAPAGAGLSRTLVALILGQIGLHSAMAGVRLAAPLQALRDGHNAWAVGVLLGLFAAAPVFLAMPAGRLADRRGYHRPIVIAVWLTGLGAMLALLSTFTSPALSFALLCVAAMLVGAGANTGIIAIQRTAGRSAATPAERVRVFSWVGLAPSLSNVIGAVSAGLLIDAGGFRAAFAFMLVLPLLTLAAARRVPREAPAGSARAPRTMPWDLLAGPGMKRLFFINWLLSASWDVHTFAVPILGHERGISASAIGLVLGLFTGAVSAVRVVIPWLAHRLDEGVVLRGAMLGTAAAFVTYPFVESAAAMAACAVVLGVALGAVQPMVMSTLHHLTPEHRHGEAIALRSLTMNASGAVMPLLFGVAGSAIGIGALFWLMGALVGGGSQAARGLAVREAR